MPVAKQWADRARLLRFFADHQRCGRGFDFSDPDDFHGGTLTARCRGCGEELEHATSATGAPGRERQASGSGTHLATDGARSQRAAERTASRAPARPREDHAAGDRARRSSQDGAPSPSSVRGAGSRALTGGLIVLAIASAAFAAIRLSSRSTSPSGGGASAPASVPQVPAPPAAPTNSGSAAPAAPTHPAAPATAGAVTLGRPESLAPGGPTIALPGGWRASIVGGGAVFTPVKGGAVAVTVFFERHPTASEAALTSQARALLAREHPGSRLAGSRPLARAPGLGVVAIYPGGRERAQVLVGRDLAVLLLVRIADSATPEQRAAALAAADSLRIGR
jgi:hypothetical protein